MKSRKLTIPAIAVLILFIASLAGATETRVGSMGGVGFYTKDNSNVYYFPGAINFYKGQVIAELRTKNTQNTYTLGAHVGVQQDKVLGVYLNRLVNVGAPAGIFDQVQLNSTTDLYLGMPLSNYQFGARLSIGFDSYKQDSTATTPGDEESASLINLGVGISDATTDIGVYVEMPKMKNNEDNGVEDKWSGTGFGVAARKFYGDKPQMVPVVIFNNRSSKLEQTDAGGNNSKIEYSAMNFALGCGFDYQLDENSMLILAVEAIGIGKTKTDIDQGNETTVSTTNLPGIFVGAESQLKNWLWGRIGATQIYQKTTTEVKPPTGDTTKMSNRVKQFTVTFGLGVTISSFQIDFRFNEGLLFDGPNFISGTTETLANQLSVTYSF